jgi:UDP-glucose 4-epimerase
VYQAIAAGRFRMIGGGKNHYQPIDVTDLAEYLIRCGTTSGIEGRIYILAGRRAYTLRDIVGLIEEELGVRTSDSMIPISALRVYRLLNEWMLAGTGRSLPRQDRAAFFLYDRSFDISRSLNELAYTPEIPLEETIRRTVATYRERGWLPQSTPPLP